MDYLDVFWWLRLICLIQCPHNDIRIDLYFMVVTEFLHYDASKVVVAIVDKYLVLSLLAGWVSQLDI